VRISDIRKKHIIKSLIFYCFISKALTSKTVQVIITSPESSHGQWAKAIEELHERVCVLALDEAHCLSEW
jgi:superfamily II DNA helicase RecQ